MINLTDVKQVKALQASLRTALDGAAGKEIMEYLEQLCGWYDFQEVSPDRIMIQHGKRQVLATLKTLLDLPPEQVAYIAKQKEY